MHARVTTLTAPADRMDVGAKMIEEQVIPEARKMAGFVGGYWMTDGAGKVVGVTLWESQEALRASEEAADKLREGAVQETGGTIQSVERYEVIAQA